MRIRAMKPDVRVTGGGGIRGLTSWSTDCPQTQVNVDHGS